MRRSWFPFVLSGMLAGCAGDTEPPTGPGVSHLASRFRHADGSPVAFERHALRGIWREAFELPQGTTAVTTLNVPEDARLRLAVAARGPEGPCSAEIIVRSGTAEEPVWARQFETRRRWIPVEVDLAPHAGREVDLELRVSGAGGTKVLWGSPVVAGHRGARPNVLLYELDTLRADLLESFGYPGRSSPVLGALARGGSVFASCHSTSSWTRPGAASILTSRSAPALGMIAERSALPDDVLTWTEILRERGWYTVAFLTNPNAGPPAGFDQGFDVVFEMNALLDHCRLHADRWEGATVQSTSSASGTSELVAFRLADLLPELGGLPLFLYLHPMDPHTPYDPRPPFADLPGFGGRDHTTDAEPTLEPYGQDVRAADHFLGKILQLLERDGFLNGAVTVFVSDHGEEFGDHGGRGHGRNLYVETLRVPLVISAPGSVPAGRVIGDRVTTLDVLPTVLGLLGVEEPPGLEGRSLLPLLSGPRRRDPIPEEQPSFSHVVALAVRINEEAMLDPRVIGHVGVQQGPWKCVVSDYGAMRGRNRVELFDLRVDPGERDDVAADHPDVARELELVARAWWNDRREGASSEERPVDPEVEEQLRALGYVE